MSFIFYKKGVTILLTSQLVTTTLLANPTRETPIIPPPITIEYKKLYGTKNANVLISQPTTTKITLNSSGKGLVEEVSSSEEKTIPTKTTSLSPEESKKVEEIGKKLLALPNDNPWTPDYLWEGTKSYTAAEIVIRDGDKTHQLLIVISFKDEETLTRKIEDIPEEVTQLMTMANEVKNRE